MSHTVQYRKLGFSDLFVAPVALGHSMGQQTFDLEQASAFDKIVHTSLQQGFNFLILRMPIGTVCMSNG